MATNHKKATPSTPAESAQSTTTTTTKGTRKRKVSTPPPVMDTGRDLDAERHAQAQVQAKQAQATRDERARCAATSANYASASQEWKPALAAPEISPEFKAEISPDVLASDHRKLNSGEWKPNGPRIVSIVAGAIFKRLQYPKQASAKPRVYKRDCRGGKAGEVTKATRENSLNAKMPRLLNSDDYCEVFQTVASVLSAADLTGAEVIPHRAWLACFRACRDVLRLNNRAADSEVSTDPATLGEYLAYEPDAEAQALARQRLARVFKYWHACLGKARDLSDSRKKRALWKSNLARLRALARTVGNFREMTQAEAEKASKDKAKILAAVELAELAWTAEAEAEASERNTQALAREMTRLQ
jgi:hypothetical protein